MLVPIYDRVVKYEHAVKVHHCEC